MCGSYRSENCNSRNRFADDEAAAKLPTRHNEMSAKEGIKLLSEGFVAKRTSQLSRDKYRWSIIP